jgi:hypothetical protein
VREGAGAVSGKSEFLAGEKMDLPLLRLRFLPGQ